MRYVFIVILLNPSTLRGWGFFAHQEINKAAVFILPEKMIGFYKKNILYLSEKSVSADKRRYIAPEETPKHYIDIDVYGDSAIHKIPRNWGRAVEMYSEDTLLAYGIVPYHIYRVSHWLINAFKNRDASEILRLSADIGHYIADSNVPLHTTKNYNGQLTNQIGIHGLWESRLPELFFSKYDLLTESAEYVSNLQLYAWQGVIHAHHSLDSVFYFEQELTKEFKPSKKYGYEERGRQTIRTYSYDFSEAYHQKMNGMVERRMRESIKMIGDFWMSCWVKAGQPNLHDLEWDMKPAPEADTISHQPIWKHQHHKSR